MSVAHGDGRDQRNDFASRARARKWRSRACGRVAHARQGRRSGASGHPQRDRSERASQRQRHRGSRIAGARGGARRLEHAAADESGWNAAPARPRRGGNAHHRARARGGAAPPVRLAAEGDVAGIARKAACGRQGVSPRTPDDPARHDGSGRAARADRKGRRGHPGERCGARRVPERAIAGIARPPRRRGAGPLRPLHRRVPRPPPHLHAAADVPALSATAGARVLSARGVSVAGASSKPRPRTSARSSSACSPRMLPASNRTSPIRRACRSTVGGAESLATLERVLPVARRQADRRAPRALSAHRAAAREAAAARHCGLRADRLLLDPRCEVAHPRAHRRDQHARHRARAAHRSACVPLPRRLDDA